MGRILILLFLLSTNVLAQEFKNDYFTLIIPDKFSLKDNKRTATLFAYINYYQAPHLTIKYDKDLSFENIIKKINQQIAPKNIKLIKEKCSLNCQAYYAEIKHSIKYKPAYYYYYVIKVNKSVFVISYVDRVSLENGRDFVKMIKTQILETTYDNLPSLIYKNHKIVKRRKYTGCDDIKDGQMISHSVSERCSKDKMEKSEQQVKELYSSLLAKLPNKIQNERLRKAQEAWQNFRQKDCHYQGWTTENEGLHDSIVFGCMNRYAELRIKELKIFTACRKSGCSW